MKWTTPVASECVAALGRVLHGAGGRGAAPCRIPQRGTTAPHARFSPSFQPLSVFPGASLHHPVQRRQRRGGVHVGVPLPGGEASSAGPLTPLALHGCSLTLPQRSKQNISPVKCFPPCGCSEADDAQRSSGVVCRPPQPPPNPLAPVVAALSPTFRESLGDRPAPDWSPVWSHTFPATCALLLTAF